MLKIGDKVYLHIKKIDVSINSIGFNINRLCIVKDIEPVTVPGEENVGIYKLKSVNDDKEYTVMSNDKLWKMTQIADVVEAVKVSDKFDDQYKEQVITELLK